MVAFSQADDTKASGALLAIFPVILIDADEYWPRHLRSFRTGNERVNPPRQIFPPHDPSLQIPNASVRSHHAYPDVFYLSNLEFDSAPPVPMS